MKESQAGAIESFSQPGVSSEELLPLPPSRRTPDSEPHRSPGEMAPLPSVSPQPRTALTRRRHAFLRSPFSCTRPKRVMATQPIRLARRRMVLPRGALFRDVAPLGSPRNWSGRRRRRRLYHRLSRCVCLFPHESFGDFIGSASAREALRSEPYRETLALFSLRDKEIWLGKGGRIRTECLCLDLSPDVAKL